MSKDKISAERFLSTPCIDWKQAVEKLDYQARNELRDDLSSIAQRAMLATTYVKEFAEGQDKAVSKANKALVRLRKLLGFSYPESGQIVS